MEGVTLYGSTNCPVCADSLLFAKDRITGGLFFFCPLCGCAWSHPPPEGVVDTLTPIKVFAPSGIALPTRGEIDGAGMGSLVESVITPPTPPDYLDDYLHGRWAE
jgi:hypothetical protein